MGVSMITRASKRTGNANIDNTPMRWSSELTLKGELITIQNEHNKILALVDGSRWFFKVKLLQADCLNYEWAKGQALKIYNVVTRQRIITNK